MNRLLVAENLSEQIVRQSPQIIENLEEDQLVALCRGQKDVLVTKSGQVHASTGKFTGRSPTDKFIVGDATTAETVWWDANNRMETAQFDCLMDDMRRYAAHNPILRQQLYVAADPTYRLNADIFTDSAWHALFIRHLLIRPQKADLRNFKPGATILHLPEFLADPARHGTRTQTCIALDFTRNIVLICGTSYAGEIKKAIFSLFNFLSPDQGVLPMHCAANQGPRGDVALFFGLSGTGKTTLCTNPGRFLVGDDEHGWGGDGIFNVEGGCYAKAINLTERNEPEIYRAAKSYSAVLENVSLNEATGRPDFADSSVTENTRIAYPLSSIPNRIASGMAPSPQNVVLLTADAFGVLPPLARLTTKQAVYYFLCGYTAKLAGTERGVREPQATFSACFGAPFMARHPTIYAAMLAQRLAESGAVCWLLNTGWTGGAYGTGHRIPLAVTRGMLEVALAGDIAEAQYRRDAMFDLAVPTSIDGVDPALLDPEATWADAEAYRDAATRLRAMFDDNFRSLGAKAQQLVDALD